MNNIYNDLKTTMRYNNERQQVIASNIARANMPNEKAFTLPKLKLEQNQQHHKLYLTTTQNKHLGGINSINQHFKPEKMQDSFETSINGNNINLVEQAQFLLETSRDNKVAIEIYKKYNAMEKIAISAK